jgi:streptogramin lyase
LVSIFSSIPAAAESNEATAVNATFGLEYSVANAPRNLAAEGPGRIWYTATDGIGFVEVLSDPDQPDVHYHTDFYGTGKDSQPYDLVYDRGVVWFTLRGLRRLGRIDVATRQIKTYLLLSPGAAPTGIAADPSGRLWIAQSNGRISRFDPATEQFVEFLLPENLVGQPRMEDVAYQNERTIWFTMPDANRVIVFNAVLGSFFSIATGELGPTSIAIDQTGAAWVTAYGGGKVGRYTPTTVSVWIWYDTPSPDSGPAGLLIYKDEFGVSQLWLTENKVGSIGRLQLIKTFQLTNIDRLGPNSPPGNTWGIIRAPDGHIWVADTGRNLLYELTEPFVHRLYFASVQNSLSEN